MIGSTSLIIISTLLVVLSNYENLVEAILIVTNSFIIFILTSFYTSLFELLMFFKSLIFIIMLVKDVLSISYLKLQILLLSFQFLPKLFLM